MCKLQQDPTALRKVKELLQFSSARAKKNVLCVFYVRPVFGVVDWVGECVCQIEHTVLCWTAALNP